MFRRFLIGIGFPILFTHAAYNLAGCGQAKPAEYGTALSACDLQASSWEEYTPCCVEVAKANKRDPAFCFRDFGAAADAGQADGASK